ncbi:MAG TPA: glyceraldehyde 3-phosphate dehydrogenase NAD-binding domain-containing protein [Thermodesulfovibrionales bacterium]|jgi:glyceraldehyde 3-phosphate dehydrogenase|nr:glyceraldehyde 3-phosphate dehydrogenase NAD-binding domain-containing protein [Thermodesulfovibrionales bacterium]
MAEKGKGKMFSDKKSVLGINGLGRIGKLTLWNHIARKHFSEIVVNIGRRAGTKLEDVAIYIEKDSTYGALHHYLYGYTAERVITDIDEHNGTMIIDGIPVTVLRESRNPRNLPWKEYGAKVVVEATGRFTNPTVPFDASEGSVRGHLEAGAEKVVISAPFKVKDKNIPMPSDIITVVMGINEEEYNHAKHQIISGASCTTTCLAHMVKPLMDYFGPGKIISASMDTIHSSTGTQEVLDRLPKAGATDLRKSRSVMNNIILTSTGAAKTLGLVIPEMNRIGFMAESVRIPITTGSLIILVITLSDEIDRPPVNGDLINNIYKEAAKREKRGYIKYTDEQNVSSDIIGLIGPAAIIEGHETHTRTAYISLDVGKLFKLPAETLTAVPADPEIPITNAVIYGWYDNELGSYTNMLGDLTVKIASMVYQ